VLATIIPANPASPPAGRNAWYDEMNVRIKALAQEQRVTLADLNAEMKAAGNPSSLYADDVHPNDAGYQVLAQGWFKAITRARSAAASSSPRFGFGFRPSQPPRGAAAKGSPDPSGARSGTRRSGQPTSLSCRIALADNSVIMPPPPRPDPRQLSTSSR